MGLTLLSVDGTEATISTAWRMARDCSLSQLIIQLVIPTRESKNTHKLGYKTYKTPLHTTPGVFSRDEDRRRRQDAIPPFIRRKQSYMKYAAFRMKVTAAVQKVYFN